MSPSDSGSALIRRHENLYHAPLVTRNEKVRMGVTQPVGLRACPVIGPGSPIPD